MHIHVLGGGVVGLSTAVSLLRQGYDVTVIEPLPQPGGASFGNAGLISSDSYMPQAQPGMLRKIPGWLMDPMGPLAINPVHAVKIAPWLIRWTMAGRLSNVRAIAPAMLALHRDTFDLWRDLLGSETYERLFRRKGQAYAWEVPIGAERTGLAATLREELGLRAEWLSGDEMREIFPALSTRVKAGLVLPDNGQITNPADVVAALRAVLLAEGGKVVPERVVEVIPTGRGGTIVTNCANHHADVIVVSAGIWTNQILKPLGTQVPIVAERGYHAHLSTPSIELPMPISMRSRGFAATSMSDGLRAAGTVEIAAHEAPMNLKRAELLQDHIRALFPEITYGDVRLWTGSRPSTPDSLPVIDAIPGKAGIFVCAGNGHTGMIGGPGSARHLVSLVKAYEAKRPLPRSPYSLSRFKGLRSFLSSQDQKAAS